MSHLLTSKFGFEPNEVLVLTDLPSDIKDVKTGHASRASIINGMKWLTKDSKAGDSLFFHFSGHGSQVADTDGDESDGLDEILLPADFEKKGAIVDDEIHEILVKKVPVGARLTAVVDSSHSATVLDLDRVHDLDSPTAVESSEEPNANSGEVVMFSSCRDNELSADVKLLAGVVTGALTYSIVDSIENTSSGDWRQHTYRSLMTEMRTKLRAADVKQVPQLSTSPASFDLDTAFLI